MHRLKEQLIRQKGIHLRPHYEGNNLIIGVGRKLYSRGILKEEAMIMLDNDIQNAKEEIHWLFDHWDIPIWKANVPRQHALMNLVFDLGLVILEQWKDFWFKIREEDWNEVGKLLLKTGWAKDNPERAKELSQQLIKGSYK